MVITKGSLGCEIFINGKRYKIKPRKHLNVLNTIGAGDTFFAYLVSRYLKTKDFLKSVEYAVDRTSEFLS